MPPIDRRLLLAGLAALAVAVGLFATWTFAPHAREVAGLNAASTPAPERLALARAPARRLVVHVAGTVRRPGIYRLREGARIGDALRRAGGAARGGDANAVNLAAKVTDGQQILVPRRAAGGAAAAGAPAGAAASGAGAGGAPTAVATPINLNTATAEQLDTLDGVGPATSAKILAWRQQHGGFRTVDDLAQISGIGPKRLAAMRPHVRV